MDVIPTTPAARLEHTKRAANQTGHVWVPVFVVVPDLPSDGTQVGK